jgi:ABC-type sulfate/molybdate transport systems ATPase subunit
MTGLDAALHVTRGDFVLDLALTVPEGRTVALLGPNGAGKSTAVAALAGLIRSDGHVRLGGRELGPLPPERRRIGVVFQDYLLFPHLSVLENVAFGPRASGMPRARARATAASWLDRLGIEELRSRHPRELSGGQAQRVALARALATDPELMLLDEPLAALDVEVREEVREQLAAHLRQWGGTTVVVTHSMDDVVALATDLVVLEHGRAVQHGTVREVVRSPATPWIDRLVASWARD